MEERLEKIEAELRRCNDLLSEHIKRTDLLEDYVKENDSNWKDLADRLETVQSRNQVFTIKLLAGIGTFVAVVIPLVVKLLAEVK